MPGKRKASLEPLSAAPNGPVRPCVLALAGASGSGKTTLARALAERLGAPLFPLDNYYRDLSHLPPEARAQANFDDPEMLERSLLAEHLDALSRGEAVARPLYDFATHTRRAGVSERIEPGRFLVVEGLFALAFAELLPLYTLRIYLDAPESLCLARRLRRDVEERGRTPESVRQQYAQSVLPARRRFVEPSAERAELRLSGEDTPAHNVEAIVQKLQSL